MLTQMNDKIKATSDKDDITVGICTDFEAWIYEYLQVFAFDQLCFCFFLLLTNPIQPHTNPKVVHS